ncbi:MAG: hypothetical protein KGL73_08055 [Burkholderiales bacterium]|nr:hypothetical protein [Burkholderiales bacterium]
MSGLRIGLALLLLSASLGAETLRDPTLPPGGGGGGAAAPAARANQGRWPVIVVDGRPHVAVGTRLYAEGQMLGRARIERITETEVWLREGRALRKVPLYAGVLRRSVPPEQP